MLWNWIISKDKRTSRNSSQIKSGNNVPNSYTEILYWVKVFSPMGNENNGTLVVEVTKQQNKWRQMKKQTLPRDFDVTAYDIM